MATKITNPLPPSIPQQSKDPDPSGREQVPHPEPSTKLHRSDHALDPWVRLAHLVRPQGRKGELLAEILTDFPERFSDRRRLFVRAPSAPGVADPREVTLEEHWLHKDRLVLKFSGVDSIEAAETLRGYDVVIPRAERAPLEEGAVYIGDLVGCTLFDRATGTTVGEIVDVDRESANMELIVVRQTGSAAELLVPFAKSYEPALDLPARRMEMTLPSGLLALNAPLTAEERRLAREAEAEDASTGTRSQAPRQRG